MKKICLSIIGLYIGFFAGFAQEKTDSSKYKNHQLTFDEANIVSSYYHQNGDHSAVTGGIGTEKLTDISNSFDVKFYRYDQLFRKHTWNFEVGIDHYTSASSDLIDLKANSSASHADTRIYPSVNWTRENEKKGTTIGAGVSYSHEFDYQSYSANINFAAKTKNRNGEFSARFQSFFDQVKLVLPTELIPVVAGTTSASSTSGGHHVNYPSSSRNTFDLALSYSQEVNKRLQVMFLSDLVLQNGYLSLPFHRVYFTDGSVHQENLPSTRFKLPLGLRANYFLGDKIILRAYYRFYTDNWGLTAHTASLEMPVKITPFVSVSPFYRYYIQTAIKYFAPYQEHTAADGYYTSNYDLSAFNSNFFGAGIRLTPPKGVFGIEHLNMLELRYGHYTKNINMQSNIITLNLKFK
ncbi:MAG TPA: DUF3570 domain-containing protein [Chitinophagaceae bacterium]|jgi:Protein of unknown function (DUF3570)|nr:DUF3570 domain-containing protein [Chitinophagaceae bacterium]